MVRRGALRCVAGGALLSMLPSALHAQSSRLYVGNSIADNISVIDLNSLKVISNIHVGPHVHVMAVQADGSRLFTTSEGDNTLRIFDTSTDKLVSDLHGFAMVDIPERKVVRRVEMPAEHPTPHEHPGEPINTLTHGLALSPDERELWVTSLLDDAMYVYDVSSQKIVGHVSVGSGPNWVAFSPDGKYVCVSNAADDDVSIIDVKARHEVLRLEVGRVPKRLVAASVPGGEPVSV